jgi:uncharacterized membrane protein YfcA
VATDLCFAGITKSFGVISYFKKETVEWPIVRKLWWGSLPSALFVCLFIVSGFYSEIMPIVPALIGVVLIIAAFGLVLSPKLSRLAIKLTTRRPVKIMFIQGFLTFLSGVVLAVIVGFTSVGAGALGSVFLISIYPVLMQSHRLIGTELVHAVPMTFLFAFAYTYIGLVDWSMLLSLLMGSLPIVILSSRLAFKFSGRWIQIFIAIALLSTGVTLIS